MELVGLAKARRAREGPRRARHASRPCACRSPARTRSTRTSRGSRPTACSCAAGARSRTSQRALAADRRSARRLLAQRHQLDHRRLGARPRPRHAHRRARSRSRSAARAARGGAARPGRRHVHHHIPTFHTEHCVYAHLLSDGRDYKTCGRPCEQHQVALRDRVGLVHPVIVDVGCRNTVFNAQAQSAASLVPELLARGVRRFRRRARARDAPTRRARLYDGLRAARGRHGSRRATSCARAAVHEQFGVTRGTMRTLTVLR